MTEPLEIPIESIVVDSKQPRKKFDEEKIRELADSIKQHGLLQSILVRKIKTDKFQLIVGERRLRACKLLGMKTIKADVKELADAQAFEIQLVENLQREDLDPLEEAEGFQKMIAEFKYTQDAVAEKVSKSREYVTNKLRLLKLPDETKQNLREGKITEGHARSLLPLPQTEHIKVLKEITDRKLSVRRTEELVQQINETSVPRETLQQDKPALIVVPKKIHDIVVQLAKKMKTRPEDLIAKAIMAFAENERVKP